MGFGVGGLIALAVLFLGVVMLSNVGLRGMRVDLTQNRLYTLSPGTQQVLGELKEPINLYFYFSREAAAKQAPLLLPYATRVREFLEELTARAGGKIHLRIVDPQLRETIRQQIVRRLQKLGIPLEPVLILNVNVVPHVDDKVGLRRSRILGDGRERPIRMRTAILQLGFR